MREPEFSDSSVFSIRVKAILFFLAVAAAVIAGYACRNSHRYKHVAIHEPGRMYRSAWIEPDAMAELIRKHEIQTVINLCAPGEMGEDRWKSERETVRKAGAKLLELPMPTTSDPNDAALRPHLAVLDDLDNYPILVHCQHGVTRTSKFLAIYDIGFRGKTADESLDEQPLFGRERHADNLVSFCREFEEQHVQIEAAATSGTDFVLH